jgi:hypothetical protein
MEYVLTGVEQHDNIRSYVFFGIMRGIRQTQFTVAVDIGLIRKYRISLQELPLLCRLFLEKQRDDGNGANLTYGEREMEQYAARRVDAERAMMERRSHRKFPPTEK